MASAAYGSADSLQRIVHTDELTAASDAARKKLPGLRAHFQRGLAPRESIQVKAPFKTSAGGREWMWVEVTRWKGARIDGILTNTPSDVPSLKSGQAVTVNEDDLFDYLHYLPDGREVGNTTGAIIQKMNR
jgi:uncharacterized protein YegJ (DUF2314 family)